MCFKICGAHLHFNHMQAYCLCGELYVLSRCLASNERSSEAGRLHAIPEADCGTEVTSLLHSCRGTCFKKSPSWWWLAPGPGSVLHCQFSAPHTTPEAVCLLTRLWPEGHGVGEAPRGGVTAISIMAGSRPT